MAHSILAILVLLFFSLARVSAEPVPTNNELKIAAVLSLSGMASAHGTAIKDGLEYARSKLEADGWKIEINYQDDSSEPKKTVTAVRHLTGSGYRFFVGPTWGILAIPTAQIFDSSGAISLQPCNSSDFVKDSSRNFFFLFSPPSSAAGVINAFVKEQKPKRIAILNNISEWGELWRSLFEEAARDSSGELVRTDMVQFSEISQALPTLMTRYKQEGIDLILSSITKEDTALTIQILDKLKHPAVLLSPDLIDAVKEGLINVKSRYVEGYTVTPVESKEFAESFASQYGRTPHKYTDSGHDALLALATAVNKVGTDPQDVKSFLESELDIESAAGRVKFDKNHDIVGRGYQITKLVERAGVTP